MQQKTEKNFFVSFIITFELVAITITKKILVIGSQYVN